MEVFMDYKFYVLCALALLFVCAFIFTVIMVNKIVDSKYNTGVKLRALEVEYKHVCYQRDQHEQAYLRLKEKYEIQERLLTKFRSGSNVP